MFEVFLFLAKHIIMSDILAKEKCMGKDGKLQKTLYLKENILMVKKKLVDFLQKIIHMKAFLRRICFQGMES